MQHPAEQSLAIIAASPADRPFVIGQLGQSLDGRIATPTGKSSYINGPQALDHLHRLRAAVDAVVVGVTTVVRDDPQLTVRRCAGAHPRRVIIDPRRRVPTTARCMTDGGERPLQVIVGTADDGEAIGLPADPLTGRIAPEAIVAALYARGYRRLLVEGGASTLSGFIAARAIDRLHIMLAPILIGSGTAGLCLPPIDALAEAMRPNVTIHTVGSDILFDCALESRWAICWSKAAAAE
jgi:diaminohydroxyphosphoribosylaminopyrimidine deaminase / 5-amino-6-(5-phosphoribosylamino)uracil reductase